MELEVCRICLKKGSLCSIYEKDLNDVRICDKIMQCGDVLIKPGLDLPEQICSKCLSNLEVAYEFRTTCKKSDSILQLYLKANHRNNVFVTLGNGKTYKLPEGLKLKIIRIKKDDVLEATKEDTSLYKDDEDSHNQETVKEMDDESNDENIKPDDSNYSVIETESNSPEREEKIMRLANSNKGNISLKRLVMNLRSKNKVKEDSPDSDNSLEEPPQSKVRVQIVPDDKPSFICEICGNCYKQNALLVAHMRRHRNERPFACEICSKSFVTTSLLARHIKTHTGNKPFKCQFCTRRFYEKGSCRAHERVHTGIRRYKCGACGKAFMYSQGLTKHQLIHTGEKLYSCDKCGKEFRLYHHLKAHLNTLLHKNREN